MGSQVLIQPVILADSSGFINITGSMLPATLQANDLGGGESIAINSVSFEVKFAGGRLFSTADATPGQIVTIGSKVYTMVDVFDNSDGFVTTGGTIANSMINLFNAINLGPGAGVTYGGLTTLNLDVEATGITSDSLFVRAKAGGVAGNSVITTTDWNSTAWDNPTLIGGSTDSAEAIFLNGTLLSITSTNNRVPITFPMRIQVTKPNTTELVGVTLAYNEQV